MFFQVAFTTSESGGKGKLGWGGGKGKWLVHTYKSTNLSLSFTFRISLLHLHQLINVNTPGETNSPFTPPRFFGLASSGATSGIAPSTQSAGVDNKAFSHNISTRLIGRGGPVCNNSCSGRLGL
jgi:hypothetical protein